MTTVRFTTNRRAFEVPADESGAGEVIRGVVSRKGEERLTRIDVYRNGVWLYGFRTRYGRKARVSR